MGCTSHRLPNQNYKLWTRGGTNGVFIRADQPGATDINIPAELIRMLVADDIRNKRISELEQMDDDQLLAL